VNSKGTHSIREPLLCGSTFYHYAAICQVGFSNFTLFYEKKSFPSSGSGKPVHWLNVYICKVLAIQSFPITLSEREDLLIKRAGWSGEFVCKALQNGLGNI